MVSLNTNQALDATQARISTGLKIGEAKDNAVHWAISTTLKSDGSAPATGPTPTARSRPPNSRTR